MATAARDNNSIPVLLGTLDSDGKTPTPVKADPSTHAIKTLGSVLGTDRGIPNAPRDANSVITLLATSSVDGLTTIPVYADSNGNLLID